jgi:adenosylmethionine-8-amino-7-oxononanoate aminotransferase
MSGIEELIKQSHLMRRIKSPILMEKGEGIYLFDTKGNKYIDGSGGPAVVGIGYGVEEVIESILTQAKKACYWGGLRGITPIALEWAEALSSFAPGNLKYISPTAGGGSDATEMAMKMVRQYWVEKENPSKYKVVSRWMSWHGSSMGAMSVSGHTTRRKNFIPHIKSWPKIPPAYCYRCWYQKNQDNCNMDCARELERVVKMERPENITMFIAEPVVGASLGTVPAPKEYFKIIREICDDNELFFCADEVMTGFGRTGKNFGIEHWGVLPDLMVCAKGITSGYMPMGAVIASNEINSAFEENPAQVGSTFSGHPLACAASLAVINYIVKNKLVQNVASLEKQFFNKLNNLYEHPSVGDVRGIGFFAGIEFVKDKETKETFAPELRFGRQVQNKCWENGLGVYVGTDVIPGVVGDHIQIAPMLICTSKEIDTIVEIIDISITQVEEKLNLK